MGDAILLSMVIDKVRELVTLGYVAGARGHTASGNVGRLKAFYVHMYDSQALSEFFS